MTRPLQPWLHEFDITVDGPLTVISEPGGDLGAAGTGILLDDRRMVRTLRLRLDGVPCVPVASSALGAIAEHWGAARHLGYPGPDPTVEVHRRRVIDGTTVCETITVQSRNAAALTTTVTMVVDGDGAELGAIKAGRGAAPLPATSDGAGAGWRDERHGTRVVARPAPSEVVAGPTNGLSLSWPVALEPAGAATIVVAFAFHRRQVTSFDADAGAPLVDWDPEEVAHRTSDPRVAELVRIGLTDLRHLTLRDPLAPGDLVAAAGTPWYLTLFGRDAIWSARFMVGYSPALVAGTLRSLARRQANHADTDTAAEPGKILHELRRTQSAAANLGLRPLYYGTVDATPLWVVLLREGWRAGMPTDEVTDLLPALDAALGWMEAAVSRSPDGLLRYVNESHHGLSNHGWKDSGDAMRRADGSIAPAPIALLEAQAYAVAAAHAAADLGDAVGRDAARWRRWADDLAARVRDHYWVGDGDDAYLAMALDGHGRPVGGVGSNMGHALGTGLLTPAESERVVARLLRPDMLREFGIGTLSSENPAYNPIGYHTGSVWAHDTAIAAAGMARAGFGGEAAVVAERLLRLGAASGYRLPELCGGEPVGRRPVPYPAACRPQAWAAAAATVVLDILG